MKRLYKDVFLSTLITFKLFSQLTTNGHDDKRGTANGRGQQSRRVEVGTRRPWQGSKDGRQTIKRRCCRGGIQSFNSGACVTSLQDHHRRLTYGTRGVGYVARGASSGEDQNQEHPHKVQHPHHQGRNDHQSTRVIGQHKREESVIQPHGTCWREPYLRADGVPLCVPEELLQADPAVISATRMTRWCKQSKSAQPTEMVKVQLAGKEHPPRFTRGYGSYKMRTFNPGPLQCFNCQKYGHLVVSCIREVPTCRHCAGPHTSKDCKGKTDITLKCSNCKGPHATTSMNCQARRNAPGSMIQIVAQTKPVMEAPKKPVKKTVETFVPAAQDFPDSINAAETRKRRRFDQSIPSMPHKKPAASVSVQQPKDPVPPKAALSRHCTWGKQKTLDKQPEVEEPEQATITVALQAAWSLLADIKQGNRRMIPALTKMIEAAVNATKPLM